jgi:hypothetical protein
MIIIIIITNTPGRGLETRQRNDVVGTLPNPQNLPTTTPGDPLVPQLRHLPTPHDTCIKKQRSLFISIEM